MTLTGIANTFGDYIVSVGRDSLILSLILTMITCLVLGMGIPTIPNYIITSTIAGPALLALGIPLLVSHMRQIGRHDEVGAGLDHVDQYARIKRLD